MDRRRTLKWMLAASAMPLLARRAPAEGITAALTEGAAALTEGVPAAPQGYGTDPDLTKIHHPGDLWPLTLSPAQRRTAAGLCDVIIPADAHSPSASSVGVVDFLDEWVSAPYPNQREDRALILEGLLWMDAEASRRFAKQFADLDESAQHAICDDICYEKSARPQFAAAAKFFARYRDLTAGGFYTSPEGRKDLGYIGNVPLLKFSGPPAEVLRKVGLNPPSS
jgi:gluconate 2-dehydrogenase subunit 3-like protein